MVELTHQSASEVSADVLRQTRFDAEDAAWLRDFHPLAATRFDSIADDFYREMRDNLSDRADLAGPRTGLRDQFRSWVSTMLIGPWDEDYFERTAGIGRAHVRAQLPQRYMCSAMAFIERQLTDIALSQLEGEALRSTLMAISKLIAVELSVMLEAYRLAYAERLEEAERERRVALERQLAITEIIAAGLAHEIRNPLNAAKLQLLLVDRRLVALNGTGEAAVEASQRVGEELERLDRVVRAFLDFARPTFLELGTHDIADVLHDAVLAVVDEAHTAGVKIVVDTGEQPLVGHVDPKRLRAALIHLLRNAIESKPASGSVTASVSRAPDFIEVRVRDDGNGIPAHIEPFAPFSSSKPQARGLGLPIAQRIVGDHGGEIRIQRSNDHTVVVATVPLQDAAPLSTPNLLGASPSRTEDPES